MTILYNGNPDGLLTYTSPSPKLCMGPSGTYRYGPHNLYVNSASPANQSITVVSGADYTIVITGSVSVTASGAATGTWTAGTTNFTAATGTLTLGSTSGAGTVHVRRTNSDTTYLQTSASARYGLPYEWDSSGVLQGILVEEARTNLYTYSSQFDNAVWQNAAPNVPTVLANSSTAPDGTTTADTLTAATGGTSSISRQAFTGIASTTYTFSCFLSSGTSTQSRILLRDTTAGTNFADATIAWSAGVPSVSGTPTGTITITSVGASWYRIAATGTSGASASPVITCSVFPDTAAGTNNVKAWGAQMEAGAFATSPIETFGATVTRAQDVITLALSAIPTIGTNATAFADSDISIQSNASAAIRYLVSLYDGPASNYFYLRADAGTTGRLQSAESGTPTVNITAGTLGAPAKLAGGIAANDAVAVLNGTVIGTDATCNVPSGMTTVRIGGPQTGGTTGIQRIRKIMILTRRMSNAELQALTT